MPLPTINEFKSVADAAASSTATTLTLNNAISVGDRVFVIYTIEGFATASFPLTENLGNTIGAAVAGGRPNSGSYAIHSYTATNGGTPTFTVTKNGGATTTVCSITAIVVSAASYNGVDGTYKSSNGTTSGSAVDCSVTLDASTMAENYIVTVMVCSNTARTTPTAKTQANVTYTNSAALNDIGASWFTQTRTQHGDTTATGTFSPGWTLNKANADEYRIVGFAIKGTTTDPAITGGTANPVHLSTGNTITGTNFGASYTGSAALTIGGQAQTVTAWSDTSITYTANRGVNLDNVAVNAVVTNSTGVSSVNYALTGFQPPSGYYYVALTSVNTTAAYRITSIADLAIGNQLEWDNSLVTIYNDGTYVADPSVTSFNVRAGVTTDGWGALAVQTINGSSGTLTGDRRYLKLSPNIKLGYQ